MRLHNRCHLRKVESVIAISLQSGSNGNCVYVESGSTGILLDAGIPGIHAERRLLQYGRSIHSCRAVVLSHDHHDHARHAGVFRRKFRIPLYSTPKTMARVHEKMAIGTIGDLRAFEAGDTLTIDDLTIETIPTPHDGVDGVAFVVSDGRSRLGVLTDLGHVFDGLSIIVATLDGVIIESNYDPEMLTRGPYPVWLQDRIRGPRGHLSNDEAATLLETSAGGLLKWACLAHLSENNNHPDIAIQTHRALFGSRIPLFVANRYSATDPLEL